MPCVLHHVEGSCACKCANAATPVSLVSEVNLELGSKHDKRLTSDAFCLLTESFAAIHPFLFPLPLADLRAVSRPVHLVSLDHQPLRLQSLSRLRMCQLQLMGCYCLLVNESLGQMSCCLSAYRFCQNWLQSPVHSDSPSALILL